MSEQLQPIQPRSALENALTELRTGFNFERYGVPVDHIDLEHFRNALAIVELLYASQGGRQ